MSKRKKTNPSSKAFIGFILLGVAVVGVLALYVKGGADRIPEGERRVVQQNPPSPSTGTARTTKTYYVFDPASPGSKSAVQVADGQDPVRTTVDAYAKAVYPDGKVKLLSIDVNNRVASPNFTKGFAEETGSLEESQIVEGLMRTLGQFENIDKVTILSDGEPLETGHNIYENIDVVRG